MSEERELGIICVQCSCGRRTWLRDTEVNFTNFSDLEKRLRCQSCGSRKIDLSRPWRTVVNDPAFADATFRVEVWDEAGSKIYELVATSCNSSIAIAAYEAALIQRPNRNITLRWGARVLRKSRNDD